MAPDEGKETSVQVEIPAPKGAEAPKPEEPKAPDLLDLGKGAEPDAKPSADDAPKEPEKAPTYDFKLPEDIELDEAGLNDFKEFAASEGLAPDKAQTLLDKHVSALRAAQEEPFKLWVDTQKKWVDEVQKDSEIGGDNLANVKATVAKALDRFGGPGIREALSLTGAGNNPAIIKMFYKMAKELTEGGPISGNPARGQKAAAEVFYPNAPTGET